ncbi:hypothetical protein, partial [Bradyrhizobium sp. NBAIM08]|uniref:hypothetical protein n=1 Tax=Bradyrhizobium sp. NBAIM08 TaxID=2793815 RepID=UPI001CD7A624
ERVGAWAARTYDVLAEIVAGSTSAAFRLGSDPGAILNRTADQVGVRMMPGRELLAANIPDPVWSGALPDFRRLEPAERAGHDDGWGFTAPVVDMPRYLDWLLASLRDAGGRLEIRRISDLEAEARSCDLLVNCTGLAARELAPD